jgi:hypothetical protein
VVDEDSAECSERHEVPDLEALAERLQLCLQESDEYVGVWLCQVPSNSAISLRPPRDTFFSFPHTLFFTTTTSSTTAATTTTSTTSTTTTTTTTTTTAAASPFRCLLNPPPLPLLLRRLLSLLLLPLLLNRLAPDFTQLVDETLFKFDTNVIPEAIECTCEYDRVCV